MMSKFQKNYLILSLLFYIIPVLIFGNMSSFYDLFLLIFSSTLISFLIKFKSNESKKWTIYISGFLQGAFLSHFGLEIFQLKLDYPSIQLSIDAHSIVTIISILGCSLFSNLYRDRKINDYLQSFHNDNELIERDRKINNILNNWFN